MYQLQNKFPRSCKRSPESVVLYHESRVASACQETSKNLLEVSSWLVPACTPHCAFKVTFNTLLIALREACERQIISLTCLELHTDRPISNLQYWPISNLQFIHYSTAAQSTRVNANLNELSKIDENSTPTLSSGAFPECKHNVLTSNCKSRGRGSERRGRSLDQFRSSCTVWYFRCQLKSANKSEKYARAQTV